MWQCMFAVGSRIRRKQFPGPFFRYAGAIFQKIVVRNSYLTALPSQNHSNALFRDSRMHNLKNNWGCVFQPLFYLNIEFHQNRWYHYGTLFFRYNQKSGTFWQFLKYLLIILDRISKVYRCGNSCFKFGQISEIKKFSGPFFQLRRGNFSKFLGLKFIVLLGLSNCIIIPTSFSNAFFRDSRMQNLKMLGSQNFCLPFVYLDNEFHQNRLNSYGSQFFQVHKIPVPVDNFENVYK